MRSISLLVLLFIYDYSFAQQPCTVDEILDKHLLTKVEYNRNELDIDLSPLFFKKDTYAGNAKYLAFIGRNKKRLFIDFDKIERTDEDKGCYKVTGETTVFNGATRKFSGDFILKGQYAFNNDELEKEEEFDLSDETHGFSILNFKLYENRELTSTGIFEGFVLVRWYKDKNGKYQYDDLLAYNPSYANCIFIGTWKSYKTGNESAVAWSHFRIPCSGDLDWGASEFSPAPEYHEYGWSDYKP
ncbi:MAG: hypothetical protein AAF620_19905 [Bacteroidota bacterium]